MKTSKRQTVGTASVPAPVGGLNARDAIANMPETDAIILDNWFAEPSDVGVRNGYSNWVTGLPGWVESLMHYNGPVTKKLFAASGTAIYDVTSAGAVGAAVVSGLTNARWQSVIFGNAAGNFLYLVNGADSARLYDGGVWSVPVITGVASADLIHINTFKNRVWFVEKNSTHAWYLPINAIAGAATKLDLGPLFRMGGYLMALVTWTIDNANGVDDYAAFVSSEGEVALYRGIDPDFSSTWALVGTFHIGRPIGRRCFVKVGSDVILITADGFFPLSKALLTDRSQLQDAISNKIVNLVNSDVQAFSGNFGWQPILYPLGNKLLINVPSIENSSQYQYVMNTITGAWCTFGKFASPWNAACFEVFSDGLYYGGNTVVCLADSGQSDNGTAITADVEPAFNYFGERGKNKRFTMVRPIIQASGNIQVSLVVNTDFGNASPSAATSFSGGGSPWDTSPWDTSAWSDSLQIKKDWQTVNGIGFCGTAYMRAQCSDLEVKFQSMDYVFETGGIL